MTRRNTALGLGSILLALSLGACGRSPAEAQAKANEAEARAVQTAAEVRSEADLEVAKAQAKADVEARKADEVLTKARDDLRTSARRDLDDISKRVDDLEKKAEQTSGRHRADVNAALKDIDVKRAAVDKDITSLAYADASDFERLKADLGTKLDDLEKAVTEASANL